ncbi:MAG: alpha/beta hydrolase, partial [Planctomycetia bacterium]
PGPIFIGQGVRNRSVAPARAVEAQHLLYSAGLDVELRTYQAGHETTPEMLRDVDRWIMRRCF